MFKLPTLRDILIGLVMLGLAVPGFAYFDFLDDRLFTPRCEARCSELGGKDPEFTIGLGRRAKQFCRCTFSRTVEHDYGFPEEEDDPRKITLFADNSWLDGAIHFLLVIGPLMILGAPLFLLIDWLLPEDGDDD